MAQKEVIKWGRWSLLLVGTLWFNLPALGPQTRADFLKGLTDEVQIIADGKLQLRPGTIPTGWKQVTPITAVAPGGRHDSWAFRWYDGTTPYLFLSGGQSHPDGTIHPTNFRAAIQPDYSLGAWERVARDLPEITFNTKGTVYDNRFFFVAGWTSYNGTPTSGGRTDVNWIFPLFSGGEWGPNIDGPDLKAARHTHELVNANGFLYTLGGHVSTSAFEERSELIPTSPYLAPWQVASHPLQFYDGIGTSINPGATYHNWKIYYFGGDEYRVTSKDNGVWASVQNDGNLDPWVDANGMPERLMDQSINVLGGKMYILGGRRRGEGADIDNHLNVSYFAKIKADGTLENWQSGPALPHERSDHTAVNFENTLFVLGGTFNDPKSAESVWSLETQADGTFPFNGTYCSSPVEVAPGSTTGSIVWAADETGGTITVQYKTFSNGQWSAYSAPSAEKTITVTTATPYTHLTYVVNFSGNGTATPILNSIQVYDANGPAVETLALMQTPTLTVWPNPVSAGGAFSIIANSGQSIFRKGVVFDSRGKSVLNFPVSGNGQFRIPAGKLSAGVYLVKMIGTTGNHLVKKVVILK